MVTKFRLRVTTTPFGASGLGAFRGAGFFEADVAFFFATGWLAAFFFTITHTSQTRFSYPEGRIKRSWCSIYGAHVN
jgi:hypothetical protein